MPENICFLVSVLLAKIFGVCADQTMAQASIAMQIYSYKNEDINHVPHHNFISKKLSIDCVIRARYIQNAFDCNLVIAFLVKIHWQLRPSMCKCTFIRP